MKTNSTPMTSICSRTLSDKKNNKSTLFRVIGYLRLRIFGAFSLSINSKKCRISPRRGRENPAPSSRRSFVWTFPALNAEIGSAELSLVRSVHSYRQPRLGKRREGLRPFAPLGLRPRPRLKGLLQQAEGSEFSEPFSCYIIQVYSTSPFFSRSR